MEQRPARILVVDDESAIRFTLDLMLRRRGYLVTTAESGVEALAVIERQAFDLLLLDLKMPGISGIDIARRAREILPEAAILILTGSTTIEGLAEAPGLEQFDVLIKTASPQEVLDRVAEVVG
jgi:two-component system, NtrC family, response regulator AtoC